MDTTEAGIRVLIVDDDHDAADSQAEVLRSMGHQAEVAYTSRTAMEIAPSLQPDLYLLDLALPDMDGYDLARHLRGDAVPHARFVALSGYGPGVGGNLANKLFDEHVMKPMGPQMLDSVLGRVSRDEQAV
jgi:CheY-like chemotaxis protein